MADLGNTGFSIVATTVRDALSLAGSTWPDVSVSIGGTGGTGGGGGPTGPVLYLNPDGSITSSAAAPPGGRLIAYG